LSPADQTTINDKITFEDAAGVWGLDCVDSQEEIARRVIPSFKYGEWAAIGNDSTTRFPAIACIGLAGENKCRIASIVHGAGSSAAQGGYGGVWYSKKLKAISVIGTGDVPIADPIALMNARLWFNTFQWNVDNPIDPAKCCHTRATRLCLTIARDLPGFIPITG
jgi:aldehyde:ferredoxin oxidoreductase